MSNKIKVLVVGARGGFGGAVLRDLRNHQEFQVSAMVRSKRGDFDETVPVVLGDATNRADLFHATEGIDVLVYGVNFPYQEWGDRLVPAVSVLAEVAAERKLRVVFPGNVYGLDPAFSEPRTEDAPRRAVTEKGRLRNRIEDILVASVARGAKLLVVRAGDFFGPGAQQTWFRQMTKGSRAGAALLDPQPSPALHAWAYLPDLAKAVGAVLLRYEELDDCEFFHFRGHEASAHDVLEICRAALDDPDRKIRKLPWGVVAVVGWFSPFVRELVQMKYLWDAPLLLDDTKLHRFLGSVPHTPLLDAVAASLEIVDPESGRKATAPAHELQSVGTASS